MSAFELIRDLHKDARGFRPSQGWMEVFNGQSDVEQEATWNSLCDELEQRNEEERNEHLAAQKVFELRIAGMMEDYTITRGTALRWDMDSFDVDIGEAIAYHGMADQELDRYLWQNRIAYEHCPAYLAELKEELGL